MYFPIEKRLVDVHHQLGLYHCLLHSAIPRKGLRGAFFLQPLLPSWRGVSKIEAKAMPLVQGKAERHDRKR